MSDSIPTADATSIPATAMSGNTDTTSKLVIGETTLFNPFPSESSGFMFAVVDLSSLEIVAKAAPVSNTTVPPEIQPYAEKEGYFLFFITYNGLTESIPQGDLYAFLKSTGSGAALENLEQIVAQIGTGSIGRYSYILAGTLDSGDLPGFEALSMHSFVTLPMQFTPYTINGQTMYAPSRYSTP